MRSQASLVGLVLVGAVALIAGVAAIDPSPVGVMHDDAGYVVLGRALATGQGYRVISLPGSPAAIHAPPGYPALLAVLWRIAPDFPENLVVFKAFNLVLLAVGAVLVTRFAEARVLDRTWAVGLGLLSAISIPMLIFGSMVLSEPLFFVLLIVLLPPLESLVERPSSIWRTLLLGVGIAAIALVRSQAVALLLAMVLLLGVRRRWRDAGIIAATTIVCLVPWQLWVAAHGHELPAPLQGAYGTYTAWWVRGFKEMGPGMIPATLAKTASEATRMFAALFSPMRGALPRAVTIIALAALAVTGIHASWRRIPVTLLFLAGHFVIVLLWPFAPTRFIWGLWPLILLVLFVGASKVVTEVRTLGVRAGGSRARVGRLADIAALAWVAIGYGMYEVRGIRGNWWSSIPRLNAPRIIAASEWVAANTAPGEVVAAEDEGAVYLYTGRLSVPTSSFTAPQYFGDYPPAENAAEGLSPILAAYPVRTVVVGTQTVAQAADFLASARPPKLKVRAEFPLGVAYTVLGR